MRASILLLVLGACGRGALDPDQVSHDTDFTWPTRALAVDGGRLYARTSAGVEVLDGASLIGSLDASTTATSGAITVSAGYAYASEGAHIDVIAVSDPTSPVRVEQVATSENVVALGTGDDWLDELELDGVGILDLADPAAPGASTARYSGGGFAMKVVGPQIFLGTPGGIELSDIGSSGATLSPGPVYSVDEQPGYVYGTSDTALVWGLDDGSNRSLTSTPVDGGPTVVRAFGDRLLVGSADGTVTFFTIENPIVPVALGTIHAHAPVVDFAVTDDYLYVATSEDLEIYAR